jgi:hypothetical protein
VSLAERVERAILAGDPSSRLGRARLKAAIEARRALVRHGDPPVRYRVGDVELELPLSHQLPFFQHAHPAYDTAIADIAAEAGGPVVDIGANVGDTAAAIRTRTDVPILCIEGDPRFFALLERNAVQLGDVELEPAYVTGELDRILDDHPRFAAPALLKVDVDGMDVAILDANLELLARTQPVVFFEYDPHLGAEPAIFERLLEAGYSTADWYENTGTLSRTVQLPDHLHDEYVGHGGARYADVCVKP